MGIDRRELLIGLGSSAALLVMPWDRAKAWHDMELFAAARRDGQLLDDAGEHLAALGVGGALLVLDRVPLGMAGHW